MRFSKSGHGEVPEHVFLSENFFFMFLNMFRVLPEKVEKFDNFSSEWFFIEDEFFFRNLIIFKKSRKKFSDIKKIEKSSEIFFLEKVPRHPLPKNTFFGRITIFFKNNFSFCFQKKYLKHLFCTNYDFFQFFLDFAIFFKKILKKF